MRAVKAYFDGNAFIPLSPISVKPNQAAIVTVLDDFGVFKGNDGDKPFKKYIGVFSDDDYSEMARILEDARGIDGDEW